MGCGIMRVTSRGEAPVHRQMQKKRTTIGVDTWGEEERSRGDEASGGKGIGAGGAGVRRAQASAVKCAAEGSGENRQGKPRGTVSAGARRGQSERSRGEGRVEWRRAGVARRADAD